MSKKVMLRSVLLSFGVLMLLGRSIAQELEDIPVRRRESDSRSGRRGPGHGQEQKPQSRPVRNRKKRTQQTKGTEPLDRGWFRPEVGVPVGGDQEMPKAPEHRVGEGKEKDRQSPQWLDEKRLPASPSRAMTGRGLRDFLNPHDQNFQQSPALGGGRSSAALKGPWVEEPGAAGVGPDFLDRVLDKLGGYASFQAMRAFEVQRSLTAVNEEGRELFSHEFWHKVELSRTMPIDEILWSPGFRFGRRGARAWARFAGVDRPDLTERSREETLGWSLLARFPFCFRDRARFRVLPEEKVHFMGRSLIRLRIVERAGDKRSPGALNGRATRRVERHYDLYLDPKDLLPLFMEMQRNGGQRRIHMGRYKSPFAGAPRLPHERTILAEDGETPSLEIRWDIVKKVRLRR